jgi:hypothetical protein
MEGVPTESQRLVDAAWCAFEPHGFDLQAGRLATSMEVAASGSTWAKRLASGQRNGNGAGSDRWATLVRFVRRSHR